VFAQLLFGILLAGAAVGIAFLIVYAIANAIDDA
jgi:hypothetical protein